MIRKFCSVACDAKFIFTSANHTLGSLSTYLFPLFFEEWGTPVSEVATVWDNKGNIVLGNDVWIGYKAVILFGVRIGDGAIIGTRAVVTRDVEPYTIVGGVPDKLIRKRYDPETIRELEAFIYIGNNQSDFNRGDYVKDKKVWNIYHFNDTSISGPIADILSPQGHHFCLGYIKPMGWTNIWNGWGKNSFPSCLKTWLMKTTRHMSFTTLPKATLTTGQ